MDREAWHAAIHGVANESDTLGLRGKAGGGARVTAGQKKPHPGLCLGPNVPLKGRQGSQGGVPDSPGASLLFRCARPSGVPRGPATSTGSLASQRHPGNWRLITVFFIRSVAQLCPTLCDPTRSSPRLTSIESVMPSSHLNLCRPLLHLPPVPPSIRVYTLRVWYI